MPEGDDISHGTESGLAALREELAALRRQVAGLRSTDDGSIRCRRLAILGPDGTEWIVLEASESSGSVRVGVGPQGRTTSIELFVVDAIDGDPATVGLAVTDRGDVVALLDLRTGGSARWWGAGPDEPADWSP